MAKQVVDIGQFPNDGTGDPLRVAMDKINDNFNEVYRSLGGAGASSVVNLVSNNVLEVTNTWNAVSFLLDNEDELYDKDPSRFHGCIAHVHSTGALYYAHGQWRKLLSDNANNDVTSYADSLANVAYTGLLADANSAGFGLLNLDDISAGNDGEVLTANSSGGFTFEPISASDIDDLNDVTITNPAVNQVLTYNGAVWVNQNAAAGGGASANTFGTISVAGQTDVVADTTTDTLTFVAGSGMTITTDAANDTITFVSTAVGGSGGAANTFSTIAISGQTSVVADSTADTLNLVAGSGITLTTNDATDSITIASSGGGFTPTRVTQSVTSANTADGSSADISFANLGISYALYKIQTDKAAMVRIYKDTASRTADASRDQGVDPVEGDGVVAEFITSAANTFVMTPAVYGFVDSSETTIPVSVKNNSGSAGTVTVTLTGLKLEEA